jgi:SH3-like domain-containing protein
MRHPVAVASLFVMLAEASAAWALDYASVAKPYAILYGGPSYKAAKNYVISRHTPLERIVNLKNWVKVRDQGGTLAWIAKSDLSDTRYVVVTAPLAGVHQAPREVSPLIFQVQQKVVLQWLADSNTGWIKVRYQDEATGYVKAGDVWGD